jgi:hypothetical protein
LVEIGPKRNRAPLPDTEIASPHSLARTLVIQTREEFMVARETRRVLRQLPA